MVKQKEIKGDFMKRLLIFCLFSQFGSLEAGWWDVMQAWTKPITTWYSKLDTRGRGNTVFNGAVVLGFAGVVLLAFLNKQVPARSTLAPSLSETVGNNRADRALVSRTSSAGNRVGDNPDIAQARAAYKAARASYLDASSQSAAMSIDNDRSGVVANADSVANSSYVPDAAEKIIDARQAQAANIARQARARARRVAAEDARFFADAADVGFDRTHAYIIENFATRFPDDTIAGVPTSTFVSGSASSGGAGAAVGSSRAHISVDFDNNLISEIAGLAGGSQCCTSRAFAYDGVVIIPVVDQRERNDLWPQDKTVSFKLHDGNKMECSFAQIKEFSEHENCLYHVLKNGIFGLNAFVNPAEGLRWFKDMQNVAKYQEFLIQSLKLVISRRPVAGDIGDVLGRNADEEEGFVILSPAKDLPAFIPDSCNSFRLDLKEYTVFIDRYAYYDSSPVDLDFVSEEKREIIRLTQAALRALNQNSRETRVFMVNTAAHRGFFEGLSAHWVAFLVHQNNGRRVVYYMDSLLPKNELTKVFDPGKWDGVRHECVAGFIRLLGTVPEGH